MYSSAPQSAALAMRSLLRLPSLKVSDWYIADEESFTVSLGTPVAKVSFSTGYFTMTLRNRRSPQSLNLTGFGAGGGIGVGLLPADVSGDPQAVAGLLPNSPFGGVKTALLGILAASRPLPSWDSPIFVFPGQTDSPQLFNGPAQIVSASAGDGGEVGGAIIAFFDVTRKASLEIDLANLLGGPVAAATVFALTSVKAFAFLAGIDFISDASIGVGDIIYQVISSTSTLSACYARAR